MSKILIIAKLNRFLFHTFFPTIYNLYSNTNKQFLSSKSGALASYSVWCKKFFNQQNFPIFIHSLSEDRVLHKGAWVATLLGIDYKKLSKVVSSIGRVIMQKKKKKKVLCIIDIKKTKCLCFLCDGCSM